MAYCKSAVILLCFGTRPEWLKIQPLTKVLKDYKLLFTGQHTDLLKDISVDYKITIGEGDNRLDQIVSDCLLQFPDGKFDSVLVQGDTASAFACALAAFNRKLKIYYLEAGLRTYNLDHPYPEEGYRQMIARLSNVNLCPTDLSKHNLKKEKVQGELYVVGNTVLDNLLPYKEKCLVITDSGGLQEEGSFFNKKVLVCRETTERPEGITTGHLHMCATPKTLKNKFNFIKDDAIINQKCPYGDGKSSQQIKKIL